ncbi:glycosyltransferase [uncultured Thermanaerothrix sp.]|uniref:MGDG synthase family glycosyltransferase n=1 Tax=uncultured Thermanaerothrix sp. TaxID=1195149 RepID=UPI00262C3B25|nr:glycosyltransferase [uncultured Thermanaerothrix sp.]
MDSPKRIVILTADAGFGHRSAANAVAAALQERYGAQCEVHILNPLEDKRVPFILRESQADYDILVRKAPELYRLGFEVSDATLPSVVVEGALTVMLFEVLWDLVREYRPDAILTTYPLYQAPLTAVFTISRRFVPLLTVITDLVTVHRLWFHDRVDYCLVPTQAVYDLALEYGLTPEKVRLTGIPVHPRFAQEKRPKVEIRHTLGWHPDLFTVMAVGSRRVSGLMEMLHVLNHFGAPLQVVVVAGKDEELYADLQQMEWHVPAFLYQYVTEMPTFMHAADLLVSKAGGLTVTEALASGLPMVLIDVIPGQETGNMQYVVENGAGDWAEQPLQFLEVLAHLLQNDRALLRQRAESARRLGRPFAAYEVAELIWEAAQAGPVHKTASKLAGRRSLLDLLRLNQVHWDDAAEAKEAE